MPSFNHVSSFDTSFGRNKICVKTENALEPIVAFFESLSSPSKTLLLGKIFHAEMSAEPRIVKELEIISKNLSVINANCNQ